MPGALTRKKKRRFKRNFHIYVFVCIYNIRLVPGCRCFFPAFHSFSTLRFLDSCANVLISRCCVLSPSSSSSPCCCCFFFSSLHFSKENNFVLVISSLFSDVVSMQRNAHVFRLGIVWLAACRLLLLLLVRIRIRFGLFLSVLIYKRICRMQFFFLSLILRSCRSFALALGSLYTIL